MRRLLAFAMILGLVSVADGRAEPSGAAAVSAAIPDGHQAVFGPVTFARERSGPDLVSRSFQAPPGGTYTLLLEDLGPSGVLAQVWLNGREVVGERDLAGSGRASHAVPVTLAEQNEVAVRLAGKPGSSVRLTVYGAVAAPAWQEQCDARAELFTAPPVPLDALRAVVPLGALGPPAHTLPAPHLSLSPAADAVGVPREVPVHAPGRATLLAVERRSVDGAIDVSVHLQVCADVRASLRHMSRLAPELEAKIAEQGKRHCADPATCVDAVAIEVAGGQLLGHGGGPGRPTVDFAVEDRREVLAFANPERYDVGSAPSLLSSTVPSDLLARTLPDRVSSVCGLDYFGPLGRQALETMVASADGTRRRTSAPVCGEHMQDVRGTAQGNWFVDAASSALVDESAAAALVHDHVDPSWGVFSFGSAIYFGFGAYSFVPALAGYVNTDFTLVTPGFVYCYEGLRQNGGAVGGSLLLEVFSEAPGVANRLRLYYRSSQCRTYPWSFGSWTQVLHR